MPLHSRSADDQDRLPSHIGQQLDALSEDACRKLHAHLSKRLGADRRVTRDNEPDDLCARICEFLERNGVNAEDVAHVRHIMRMHASDRRSADDRHLTDDRRPADDAAVGIRKAYDSSDDDSFGTVRGGGGRDEPPPFPGRPNPGGTLDPLSGQDRDYQQIQAMKRAMDRVRSDTPGDLIYKDGRPFSGVSEGGNTYLHGRRLKTPARDGQHGFSHQRRADAPAMDADTVRRTFGSFADRFPDSKRIRCL